MNTWTCSVSRDDNKATARTIQFDANATIEQQERFLQTRPVSLASATPDADSQAPSLNWRKNMTVNDLKTLTLRERQIVVCLWTGGSNKHIGRDLNITEGTVKVHLNNIFAKLGIASRTALTALTIVHREELAAIIAKAEGKY
jgi:DNA-binding NarL/FixJ family response regulator